MIRLAMGAFPWCGFVKMATVMTGARITLEVAAGVGPVMVESAAVVLLVQPAARKFLFRGIGRAEFFQPFGNQDARVRRRGIKELVFARTEPRSYLGVGMEIE